MFNFFLDQGNYDERKVARFEADWGFISTARVSDGRQPYETAVQHKAYRSDGMVIVEAYSGKEEAQKGHERWIKTMTSDKLPDKLVDCCNAGVAQLGKDMGMDWSYERGGNE